MFSFGGSSMGVGVRGLGVVEGGGKVQAGPSLHHEIPLSQFEKLNDSERNLKYYKALELVKEKNEHFERVLHIGSGAGLISFYANQIGFKRVYSCEMNQELFGMSKKIHAGIETHVGTISFICKHISNLTLKDLGGEKVDVIVTELVDSSFFGDKILSILCQAIGKFLKPGGIVIPRSVELTIRPVLLPNSHSDAKVNSEKELIQTYIGRDYSDTSKQFKSYHYLELNDMKHSADFKVYDQKSKIFINLSDKAKLQEILDGKRLFDLDFDQNPHDFNAFVLTFTLNMFGDVKLINDEARKDSCWRQTFFPLPSEIKNEYKGSKFQLSLKKDCLKIENKSKLHQNLLVPTKSVYLSNEIDCKKIISKMKQITFTKIFIVSFNVKLISEILSQDFIRNNKNIFIYFYIGWMDDTFVDTLNQIVATYFDPKQTRFLECIFEAEEADMIISDSVEKSGQFSYLMKLCMFRQLRFSECELVPGIEDMTVCFQAFYSDKVLKKVSLLKDEKKDDSIKETIARFINKKCPTHLDSIDYNSDGVQKVSSIYHVNMEAFTVLCPGDATVTVRINLKPGHSRPTGWLYWFETAYSSRKKGQVCAYIYPSNSQRHFENDKAAMVTVDLDSEHLIWFD